MEIKYINPNNNLPLTKNGTAFSDDSGNVFEVKKGVLKFVENDNYTSNFGFQWNKFDKTQIDKHHASVDQSAERFFTVTQWNPEDLKGLNILEVGSGAGRFSQVILKHTLANLYTVDYSNAVEANSKNNGPNERLNVFQASIYDLPFAHAQFDKVVCFGVLQHTPNFEKSIQCLVDMVRPGGELIVDFYPIRGWWTKLHAKYIFRLWTKKMSHEKLLSLIEKNVRWLIKMYQILDKFGLHVFTRFLPICDIKNTLPVGLNKLQLKEWVILDTFDMFSPEYDNPQKLSTVVSWFSKYGMSSVKGKKVEFQNNQVTTVRGEKISS